MTWRELLEALAYRRQRFELGREPRASVFPPAPVQRHHTDGIPGCQHAPGLLVGQNEREYPIELRDQVGSLLLEQVHDDLAVRARGELVLALEPASQRGVVVDLTIDRQCDAARFVEQGLGAGRGRNDAEPLVRQSPDPFPALVIRAALHREAAPVRSPMANGFRKLDQSPTQG